MQGLKQRFSVLQERWLKRRIPARSRYALNRKSVFIFPSRFGCGYLLTCCGLFLLGTNYQNNLMLLLCEFLLAIFLLHLFISYKNFTTLSLTLKAIPAVFAQQHAKLTVQLHTDEQKNTFHGGLHLQLKGTDLSVLNRHADRDNQLTLSVPTRQRGTFRLPRLTLSSNYPFGLIHCWTHLDFAKTLTVYPAPLAAEEILAASSVHQGNATGTAPGIDEFDNLRPFKAGDPMHRIAWKQAAKGGELTTKTFTQAQQEGGWLSLELYASEPLERALALLSFQITRLTEQQREFGLKLGDRWIEPATGAAHQHQCLRSLAAYQNEERPFAEH